MAASPLPSPSPSPSPSPPRRPRINWLETHSEFRGFVKDQGRRCNCWALACGLAVGHRNHLSKRKRERTGEWVLSGQYLIDNFIRYHPTKIPKDTNGNAASDLYDNYPLATDVALEFIKQHGIPYESRYPYTGQRDLREQDDREFDKVYISDFKNLGCTDQGPAAKEAIYAGLLRGPMVATVALSKSFNDHTGNGVLRPENISSESEYHPSTDDSMDDYSDGATGDDSTGNTNTSSDEEGADEPVNKDVGIVTHAVVIVGMDYEENYFIIQNSQGLTWGVNGVGNVDCHLLYDIFEPNVNDDRNRGLQGQASSDSLKTESEQREFKRLRITISEKSSGATGSVATGSGSVAGKSSSGSMPCSEAADVGLEEIEGRLGSLIEADTSFLLKSAAWKERLEAIVPLKEQVEAVQNIGISVEILMPLLCVIPGCNEKNVQDLIDFCKDVGLQSSAAATRNASIKLIGVLHKFVGPDIQWFLSDVKPTLLSTLDAEYKKIPFEGASEALKKIVKMAASSASGGGIDSLPREDISRRIIPTLLNGLESSDRKICMECLEAVYKILEEANKRKILEEASKPVQTTGTVKLFGNLRGRLYERHLNIVMSTLSEIGGFASAMGPGIGKESKHVTHSPKSLRVLGSVGAPINPAWRWFYNVIGNLRCPISETWCLTETSGFMIASLQGAWPWNLGSPTFPFFDVQVKGQGIYAFVTLAEGVQYSEELRESFIFAVRKQMEHLQLLTRSTGHLEFPRLEVERSVKFLTCPM